MHLKIHMYIYIYTSLLPSIPSTMEFSNQAVQLELAAALEVQMKLCFHWQLLWKFNWQSGASKAGRASLEASLQSQVEFKWRLKATWRALGSHLESSCSAL